MVATARANAIVWRIIGIGSPPLAASGGPNGSLELPRGRLKTVNQEPQGLRADGPALGQAAGQGRRQGEGVQKR